jgi:CheY-like chemotaxis protein
MDGLTATREIRERLALNELPIVSLTAKAMKGDREKALAAGASDYVTKPVAPERLLSVIHHWRRKSAERAAQ